MVLAVPVEARGAAAALSWMPQHGVDREVHDFFWEHLVSRASGVGWNGGGATKRRVLLAALAGAGSSRHSPPQKMVLSMVTVEQLRSYYDCKAGR